MKDVKLANQASAHVATSRTSECARMQRLGISVERRRKTVSRDKAALCSKITVRKTKPQSGHNLPAAYFSCIDSQTQSGVIGRATYAKSLHLCPQCGSCVGRVVFLSFNQLADKFGSRAVAPFILLWQAGC